MSATKKQRNESQQNTPTLVVPDDPMHLALAKAQEGMTPAQRVDWLLKTFPPAPTELTPAEQADNEMAEALGYAPVWDPPAKK